jgi:hypothetical protein
LRIPIGCVIVDEANRRIERVTVAEAKLMLAKVLDIRGLSPERRGMVQKRIWLESGELVAVKASGRWYKSN